MFKKKYNTISFICLSVYVQNAANHLRIHTALVDFTEAKSTDTAQIYYPHIL